ncbi:MAG: hypothetical protein MJH11_10640, partial [Lentisphaeria bacterium]|nr:hypothetical protein [Lentisphaeria bacterium]
MNIAPRKQVIAAGQKSVPSCCASAVPINTGANPAARVFGRVAASQIDNFDCVSVLEVKRKIRTYSICMINSILFP